MGHPSPTERDMAQPSSGKPRRKRTENLDLHRMRRLYLSMLRCSRATGNRVARSRLGTEVPALLDLRRGDLVVTTQMTPAVQLLAGGRMPRRGSSASSSGSLPVQLGIAAGIALRARGEGRKALVTLFADGADGAAWRDSLGFAAAHKLPALFFLFSRNSALDQLVADANAASVASMVVDASDAVAVYRVCQEAQVRARMGDGPAFVAAYLPRNPARTNPLHALASFLREHKYPVDDWKTPKPRRGATRGRRGDGPDSPFHVITVRR